MNINLERVTQMKITFKKQECIVNSSFSGQIVYTRAFGETFKEKTTEIIFASMSLIFDLVSKNIADFLQVLTGETKTDNIRFWVIDDDSCVTFLLPEDY